MLRELNLFQSSGQWQTNTTLSPFSHWLHLSKGPTRVGVLLSPENGKRSGFRNVVFSTCLEYLKMDEVQKTSNSQCYIPSSLSHPVA
jgi:hypothetical protein